MTFFILTFFFLLLIMPDEPISVTLNGDYTPTNLLYTGKAGEVVTLTAASAAEAGIDVTLELLLDNQRLAFNDDYDGDGTRAQIDSFVLPAAGDYTIRVNSFSGAQAGAVEVRIQTQVALPLCETQTVQLTGYFRCQIEGDGQTWRVTARDLGGTLDPIVSVYEQNAIVAVNDDHATNDSTLNTLDAQVEFTGAQGLIVQVADFAGATGTLELTVEQE